MDGAAADQPMKSIGLFLPGSFLMKSTTVASSAHSLSVLLSWCGYRGGPVYGGDSGLGDRTPRCVGLALRGSSIFGRGDRPLPSKST
ncbi:hypothetical protein ACWCY6_41810 [Streptomyces sp. 900105755]